MRDGRVWAKLLGVENTTVDRVDYDEEAHQLVARVRPSRSRRRRCGICQRRCPGYDRGAARRRWRALDLGVIEAVLEADAPRVSCREHGVVVAAVPRARHGAGHTRSRRAPRAALPADSSHSGLLEGPRTAANETFPREVKIAWGYKSADALIALAMLVLGGFSPALPGRAT